MEKQPKLDYSDIKFKDIVPMQEITMGIYIDQASKSVSIQDVNE